jgi:hypothetical protein
MATNLVLGQLIRQVSNHDLGSAGDAVLGGASPSGPEVGIVSLSGRPSGGSGCITRARSLSGVCSLGEREHIGSGGGPLVCSSLTAGIVVGTVTTASL